MNKIEYHYLIMSQKSLLQSQVIEELLRERSTYYSLTNKKTDFWLLISPNFIYSEDLILKIRNSNFYIKNKDSIIWKELNNNKSFEFFASLVTTDKDFIKWIQLRIGYFENIKEIGNLSNNLASDGVSGILEFNKERFQDKSPLISNSNYLHPSILINRYKKSLEFYFSEQKILLNV
jgi:hypothetical protein